MQTSLFLLIVEIAGTIAFAISGIRLAAAKNFDWFGAYVVGLVTAIGGGTLRDVLLGTTPFWMQNGWYMGVTGLSLLFVIVFRRQWVRLNSTFFIFDTIGLALFVVIGMQKTLMFGYPVWTAIIMGTLTGAFGGVLRDILINEVPLIFDRCYRTDASRNSSKGGSGLGLSIAKKIIEEHGGKIWATSREETGTTMYFVLRKYQEVPINE